LQLTSEIPAQFIPVRVVYLHLTSDSPA